MKQNVKILDCTLRDGGYVNDWNFGHPSIIFILNKLKEAGLDYIECGFLAENAPSNPNRTIFPSLQQVNEICTEKDFSHMVCMINYGAFDVRQIPDYTGHGVDTLRVAFHREDTQRALYDCRILVGKGYNVFVQPMATSYYSETELQYLLKECNSINPSAVYIVDSFGTMQSQDVIHLLTEYHETLNPSITIGFHSHNNLQLSFPNSLEILYRKLNRHIIIDSSVYGMGRGAGNLCTELIIRYVNQEYDKNYKLIPILEIIDNCLNDIFIRTPWGYSMPYYIASINGCHPTYATYLVNKQTLGVRQINTILSRLPENKRKGFDKALIETLYSDFQAFSIDDTPAIEILSKMLSSRDILMLAPGKSLSTCRQIIDKFINNNSPIVISVNFIPDFLKQEDILFLSNLKRFKNMSLLAGIKVVATSNIPDNPEFTKVDYSSLTKPGQPESDNAGLMLLRLLIRLGVQKVHIAGFDGFSEDIHQNYVDEKLINNSITEFFSDRNANVHTQLSEIAGQIELNFITPSLYV